MRGRKKGRLELDLKEVRPFSLGLLRRCWVDTKDPENDRELVIIPLSLQETVLKTREERYMDNDCCKSEHSKSNNFK